MNRRSRFWLLTSPFVFTFDSVFRVEADLKVRLYDRSQPIPAYFQGPRPEP
jgi:hypothetical protein